MSGFHESIRSLIAEVEKFFLESLKNEKLGKSAKSHKQDIIDKINKLKEEWPALSTVTVTEPTVKPSRDFAKDDESSRTGGSSNADDAEDPYSDSSADIPTVSAMELTDFTKAGFLEKKRPGIALRNMQKRWCVIKGNIFYYFAEKTSKKMSGAFRLTDYSFDEAPEMTKDEKKKELCFKLVRPANRTYEFMCSNKSDVEEWRNSVKQANESLAVPVPNKDFEDENDGDIYEPVGESELPDPGELYDDGIDGDIYEEEPVAFIPPPEPEQDDIYDEGISTSTHDEGSVTLPPPTLPPTKTGYRPPLPPVPDEDPYQGRPLPPKRALPKEPEAPPETSATQETEKVQDEPKSYRNEEEFENMYIGIWDCDADNEKELSFKKGDIIYIINRDFDDKSWWIGELDGKFGLVPKNYLTEAYETLTF